jgi:predicted esterase
MLHQNAKVHTAGLSLQKAEGAIILVHGRGSSAKGILELGQALHHPNLVYLAPQAANATWYPYRFLSPIEQNEPWLSSGLKLLADLVADAQSAGIPSQKIILAGFSQGACLTAEFAARYARRFGGLLVFSGGLIGPPGMDFTYDGNLDGTPVFIGCSDRDPHIPVERVEETASALAELGAHVNTKIYPGMGHTIIEDELVEARQIVSNLFV